MKIVTIILFLISLFHLSSCANMPLSNGQQGADQNVEAGNQVSRKVGHHIEVTLTQRIAGTLAGYIVAREMDRYDRQQLNHVFERGVSGSSTSWINPDTGNRYSITPDPAYSNPQRNQSCRTAEISAIFNHKEEIIMTTACREEDGRWQIQ